jgi:hypothetical protein
MADQDLQFTVVFPVCDLRGDGADHLRRWTHGQTLARHRYSILVAYAENEGSVLSELSPLLGINDKLVPVPPGGHVEIANAAAAQANTPWLVFVEGHSQAHADCLAAVAQWVDANPDAKAGSFGVSHGSDTVVARLSDRWFARIMAKWGQPDNWPRAILTGCAVRTQVFHHAGGFKPAYDLFAPIYFSARLHANGDRIEPIPGASVLHVDNERMSGHHDSTRRYVHGEFDARANEDAVFMERYFGHAPLWHNQRREQPAVARAMLRAMWAAAKPFPASRPSLARLMGPLVKPALFPLPGRIAINRLAVKLDEFVVARVLPTGNLQWERFLRAHARMVYLAQLEWIARKGMSAGLPVPGDYRRWPIEQLGPDRVVGVHGLEIINGQRFRWTEPVVLMQLSPEEDGCEIRIDTGGIRGDPLAAVIAVVAGTRVLPRDALASDGRGTLSIRLTGRSAADARDGIILICSPLVPRHHGVADPRHLGLPIVSVERACVDAAQVDRAAA